MPLILLLVLLVLFSPLAIDIYLPAIPQMAEQLGAEVTLMQGTITWFLFSMGLGQLLVGPLADRYGRKPIALGGVLLYGLSALAAGFAASLGELMLARVLQGFGACATSVAAFSVVRDSYGPKKSGQMISYLNGAICFIPALAPLLGGWLTAKAGWSANFWFMAGYAAIVGSWLLWRMPETRPGETSSSGPLISWSRYSPVLRSPSFLFNACLCMLAMAVILAYVTAAPVQLMVKLGLDMSGFSYWFTANAALNILACFLAPRFIARVGPRRTLRIGLLVITLSAMALTLVQHIDHPLAMMGPVFFSSIGFAMVLGAAAGMALAPFGHCAGTAAALLGLFQMSGSGALVGITGWLMPDPLNQLALHMWLLLPPLLLLLTRQGRRLCLQ
ncbi:MULTISPECIES: multidrug effflux MFS transporter [Aeromonas]|jgi:DHA1 family bicyclomycin/chloramphenicol resistance-like MFS transporter|uniref:Bcr/CflA family efflux transporter n=3 Tax=Aeromonas TaxID=642 RepID=A0AAP3UVL7_AERSA|nr:MULTISPECIES: multidrug effflux MFS transporter [Aeromonas]AGW01015.1 putative multidrug resistance protein [uncultured Aeromonas sp.]ELI6431632.1 multidrug effflux MFS transporter [Aeromonas salmonicida subsp. salmonicida]MBP6360601.1 multidrug effflux MFS transporter [Aeromonas sp.]ARW85240.1 Putative multidrug resistance protein [Aeromonas salmonicida]ATP10993.1 major facilitator superfamily transport protein [Aeromonas salmonicida subsp. pectinolytica 34mel]